MPTSRSGERSWQLCLIDIDLEAEGIGRWVEPGDVRGWTEALKWFEDNPDEALNMGERARKIAKTQWNHRVFAKQIESICQRIGGVEISLI